MTDFGGRALCPIDDYNDPDIREEMIWHAFEEALRDADLLEASRTVDLNTLAVSVHRLIPRIGETKTVTFLGYPVMFRATTDQHLGPDDGTVDLTATLTIA
jgi:hypothetical protein